MITLKVNGITYSGFTQATVRRAIGEGASAFSFTATSSETTNFPIQVSSFVEVFIDNNELIQGFVDIINVSYSKGSHSLEISGRSRTSILVDSSIPGSRTFKAPINLQKVIENIVNQLGITLNVVNEVDDLINFDTDLIAGVDETAFAFIERYARKSNVILTNDTNGDLVITRASTQKIDTILLNRIGEIENNIKSANISFNNSGRFSKYTVYAQSVTSDEISNENQVDIKGVAFDYEALSGKEMTFVLESEGSIKLANDRAAWEANIRRAKSIQYNCVVQDFFHDEGLWDINTLVSVYDDFATISSDMLINTVEYNYSKKGGSVTSLTLLPPDAYTVNPELLNIEEDGDTLGW